MPVFRVRGAQGARCCVPMGVSFPVVGGSEQIIRDDQNLFMHFCLINIKRYTNQIKDVI